VKTVGNILALLVACLFALTWGLLLRERIGMSTGPTVVPKYEELLSEGEDRRDARMGIYLGPQRIGETQTTVERSTFGSFYVRSLTRVEIKDLPAYMFRTVGDVTIEFFADISPLTGLRSIQVTCPRLDVRLIGTVREGQLVMRGVMAGERITKSIPFMGGPFLGEAFTPMAGLPDLKRARKGDRWTMLLVNPIVGSVQAIRVTVEDRRIVGRGADKCTLLRLGFNSGSQVWQSWVTAEGDVMVQGTPLGLTLRREDMPQAVRDAIGL